MILNDIDLSLSISETASKYIRRYQKQRLYELEKIAFDRKLPTVIIFEGWDGAGKGPTIQELTEKLDPRGFKVHTITAPRTSEAKHPWLWRFWMKTPRRGEIAIFDRSWYRRVTIERIEGQLAIDNWQTIYDEINNFERLLADDGGIFVKFWLHISEEQQLRRFIQLRQDPEDYWQVTEAYWQRHQQYNAYWQVAETMLTETNTLQAPWSIVAAHNAHYRTYAVFKIIINRLEAALDLPQTRWLEMTDLEIVAKRVAGQKNA